MLEKEIFEKSDEIIEIRRHLHMNPELSGEEYNTAKYLRKKLTEYGIEYRVSNNTGTIALIRGAKPGKTVLLRADIDALPVEEKADVDYKSKNIGVMHACGHDIHTACVLYAGKVLNDMRDELHGNVKLMFQPKEETDGGALDMINDGILEEPTVDGAFALHVEPLEKCGFLQIKDGAIMASPDDFEIIVQGRGGHGATPSDCVNPIVIGAKIIDELYALHCELSKNSKEPCVISVCAFDSGNCPNVIPDTAKILGTARTLSETTRRNVKEEIEEIAQKVCKQFGAKCEFTFNMSYPPTINNAKMNELVVSAAEKIPEIKGITVLDKSSMCGEDFSYITERVKSSYFKLGVGNDTENYPIHSSKFNADEDALPIGVAILVKSAIDFLES